MSHNTQAAGRIGGGSLIAASMFGEWLTQHGLSDAMVWIALIGLLFNVFTGLPAAAESTKHVRRWWKGPRD